MHIFQTEILAYFHFCLDLNVTYSSLYSTKILVWKDYQSTEFQFTCITDVWTGVALTPPKPLHIKHDLSRKILISKDQKIVCLIKEEWINEWNYKQSSLSEKLTSIRPDSLSWKEKKNEKDNKQIFSKFKFFSIMINVNSRYTIFYLSNSKQ